MKTEILYINKPLIYNEPDSYYSDFYHRDFFEEFLSKDADRYKVVINCIGGNILDSLDILSKINNSEKNILIEVNGLCASSAVLLLFSNKETNVPYNSVIMTHDISLYTKVTLSKIEEIRASLEKMSSGIIVETYAKKLKQKDFDLMTLLYGEHWFTGAEFCQLFNLSLTSPSPSDENYLNVANDYFSSNSGYINTLEKIGEPREKKEIETNINKIKIINTQKLIKL